MGALDMECDSDTQTRLPKCIWQPCQNAFWQHAAKCIWQLSIPIVVGRNGCTKDGAVAAPWMVQILAKLHRRW